MALVRHGDLTNPSGGVRHGDLAYTPLEDTPAVLSAAYPLDFAVGQASVRFTSDKAGETAYVVVTDSDTQPTAEQIAAGEDHTGGEAEAADSLTSAVGENEFSALSIGQGYWYAHIVQGTGEGASNRVSTVEFRVAGDDDGPDEWFWPEITTPAGDGVWPEGAEAGMPGWITRVSGGPLSVLSNGSTSSESAEWATEAQVWDQSLNDGLGGLSEVRAVSFAVPAVQLTTAPAELAVESSPMAVVAGTGAVLTMQPAELAVESSPMAVVAGTGAMLTMQPAELAVESGPMSVVVGAAGLFSMQQAVVRVESAPMALTLGTNLTTAPAEVRVQSAPFRVRAGLVKAGGVLIVRRRRRH